MAPLLLNITASSGQVALQHDWHTSGAVMRGTAAELDWTLRSSGITFKPDPAKQSSDHVVAQPQVKWFLLLFLPCYFL